MTKDQLQKELKAKVKAGIKPSDLKKLKRSKSADDLPSSSVPNPPLKKSQSQLDIPLNQPTLTQHKTKFSNCVAIKLKNLAII